MGSSSELSVIVEGPAKSGKSTVARLIAEALIRAGFEVDVDVNVGNPSGNGVKCAVSVRERHLSSRKQAVA